MLRSLGNEVHFLVSLSLSLSLSEIRVVRGELAGPTRPIRKGGFLFLTRRIEFSFRVMQPQTGKGNGKDQEVKRGDDGSRGEAEEERVGRGDARE